MAVFRVCKHALALALLLIGSAAHAAITFDSTPSGGSATASVYELVQATGGPSGQYIGMKFSSSVPLTNVYAQATVTGAGFSLDATETANHFIGDLSTTAKTSYWFINNPSSGNGSIVVKIYVGDPAAGGVLQGTSSTRTLKSADADNAASTDKILSVSINGGLPITLGQTFDVVVVYSVISKARLLVQPASVSSFDPASLQLGATTVALYSSTDGTGLPIKTVSNQLFFASPGSGINSVRATYTFKAIGTSSTSLSPLVSAKNGTYKYNTDFSSPPVNVSVPAASNRVSLAKSVNLPRMTTGGNVTYTITATNSSSVATTLTNLVDTLPAGATYVGNVKINTVASTLAPVISGSTLTFADSGSTPGILAVPAFGTLQLAFDATLPSINATYTNSAVGNIGSATIGSTETLGSAPATASTVIANADVAVTKTGPASTGAGTTYSYTINYVNNGPTAAVNVVVKDTLPATVTFVSASNSGTRSGNVVTWPTIASLANGGTGSYTVTVTAPLTGPVTNTASSTAASSDAVPANNDGSAAGAQVTTAITALADVVTTVTGPSNALAGSTITYTVKAQNNGPSSAKTVVVTDTLPAGMTFVSASNGGTLSGSVVTWPTVASIASGSSVTYTVVGIAPGTGPITNTVASTSTTADPTAANNNGSAAAAKVTTVIGEFADMITTVTGPASVLATGSITYTVTAANNGPSAATSVVVKDTLPGTVTFVSASDGGTFAAGVVTWPAVASIAGGGSVARTVTVTAPVLGPLTNTVSSTATSVDSDATNNDGSAAAAQCITTIDPLADVVTTVTGPASVPAGGSITYTVTATNNGPSGAQGVVIADTLPAGAAFVSATGGGTVSGGVVTWPSVATIANGGNVSYTVTVTAPLSGPITNTVASTATSADPNAANNDGSAAGAKVTTTITASADMQTTVSGPANALASSTITYTVTATNNGPSPALDVVITDTLPGTVTFVSATGGGTRAGSVITWPTIASMASGGSVSYTVVVTAPASGTITNTVASTATSVDPNAANNDGSAAAAKTITLIAPYADVQTTVTGPASVFPSGSILYTVTTTNNGPSPATSVIIKDTLPAGVTFVSASNSGTLSAGVVTWPTVASIASGSSVAYTVTVTAPVLGPLTNTVSSTAASVDSDATNNNGSAAAAQAITTITPQGDVVTTVTGPASVSAGGSITYTVTATNNGPSTVADVVITDTLPAGVSAVVASNGGTLSGSVVTWPAIASIASGGSVTYTVDVTVPLTGPITNTVASTAGTADPTPANNDGSAAASKVTTTITASADVQTTVSGPTNALASSTIIYTVTTTNLGPSPAVNVVIKDTIPGTVTFVSASNGGTRSASVITWPTVASLASGASVTYTVTVTAPASGTLTDTASSTQTTADPDLTNNDGTAAAAQVITVIAAFADVATTVTGPANVFANGSITYTVTATNNGPSSATSVVITDTLPAGVTFVSATGGGTNSAGVVTWPAVASMASAASVSYTVTVTAPVTGPLTNTVSSTATSTDSDATNNDGTAAASQCITAIDPLADVATTVAGPASVQATGSIIYTVTAANNGPSAAQNVVITDTLPAGTTFVSASNGGTLSAGVVTWPAVVSFASGGSVSYTVTVTAPVTGPITNTVASTAGSSDPTPANNNGSAAGAKVTTTITPVADVATSVSGPALVAPNGSITYTVTTTNGGPSTAQNVVMTNTLPAAVTFVSASNGGTLSGNVVTWPTVASIASGGSVIYTVLVTAPSSPGSILDSVASTAATPDPNAANNDGSADAAVVATTVAQSADVVTTVSGPASAAPNATIIYTVTATNNGPSPSVNVVVADTLPAGVTFVSASNGGTRVGSVVTWPIVASLANGGSVTYTVTVTGPASGTITNTVSNTAATADPDATNNDGSAAASRVTTAIVSQADVVTTVSGPASVAALASITYTVTATNNGPSPAQNVVIADTLPAGVTFVSASNGGTLSAGVVTWPAVASLASGGSVTYTVNVNGPASGTFTNTVASTSSTADPDASNNNGTAAASRVTTSTTGATVSGVVYEDANHNMQREAGESGTGLILYAKIFATGNPSGPALQAVAVDGVTGAYAIPGVAPGTYTIVIDDNNTLADVAPTLPAGWSGTQYPNRTRSPVAMTTTNLAGQDFGLIHALTLSGRVFADTGTGGGVGNDGALNGAESGLAGVTVKLTNATGATTYDTATTDGAGNYALLVPSTLAAGTQLKVIETNPAGSISTGASVGNTGGSYSRATDTVTFSLVANTVYTSVNFGDVPDNGFTTDGQLAGLPGAVVFYSHNFTAGSAGQVTFTTANTASPANTGWSRVLYQDTNGNGKLDTGEPQISGAITLTAAQKVAILVKETIPINAALGSTDKITVTASFAYTGAAPALSSTATHTDLTTVGTPTSAGLALLKAVDKPTALPGETITYTVTYTNNSSQPLSNVIIYDHTPAFTTFTSASNGALPASLTSVATVAPAVGATGALRWTFAGTLAPAGTGTVTFGVTLAQ